MGTEIDFTKGGYTADRVEERFKPITSDKMEFWWHFRELLRPSLSPSVLWRDGKNQLPDEDQRQLVGLSLVNYHVYTSIAEAITYQKELETAVCGTEIFDVRRLWKAGYSSLYTSFTALSVIVNYVAFQRNFFRKITPHLLNWMPGDAVREARTRSSPDLLGPLEACERIMAIRHHLDHYWLIWMAGGIKTFKFDTGFSLGRIPFESEVSCTTDGLKRLRDDIMAIMIGYNAIYRALSISGGYFDRFLAAKGWNIDYSDYGPPHNGTRPKP